MQELLDQTNLLWSKKYQELTLVKLLLLPILIWILISPLMQFPLTILLQVATLQVIGDYRLKQEITNSIFLEMMYLANLLF